MPKRYYFQWQDDESAVGWCIFDREVLDRQGGCIHIAIARNRGQARRIVELLNSK